MVDEKGAGERSDYNRQLPENMFWNNEYKSNERIWGEGPGELAVAAVRYIKEHKPDNGPLNILDIGCGYGRDAFYLLNNISCRITGVDIAQNAIDIAADSIPETQRENVAFHCCNFMELEEASYDTVFISNLYHLLKKDEREAIEKTVIRTLKTNGLLFLSALSVNDPEHHGKGVPIPGETNSFRDKTYIHLFKREELLEDFAFLNVNELYEHEYYEPRATGETHHHILWILRGEMVSGS